LLVADHAYRSEFVRAFLASGQTQTEFCRLHRPRGGPSERTLRSWLSTLTRPAGFTTEARAIIERAVADLQHLLQALDAVEHAQVPDVEADAERVRAQPAAGRGRQATRAAAALQTVPEPAAGECRPAGASDPHCATVTLLDDLVMTMQHAKRDPENSATSEERAMRAAPGPARERSYFSEFT